MNRRLLMILLAAIVVVPLIFIGCKAKVDKTAEELASSEAIATMEETIDIEEPAQAIATETIPPTATPPMAQATAPAPQIKLERNKDIQRALKAAGYYTGAIDGKIGPRTKKAIESFQKAQGLKVDGRVGPKTWAELERYLVSQEVQN
ncbi:MAG: peptidoglycan-binding domain-containing protein [Candidatus Omnitrophica bacterium]|nr:peptidoglycan-binding domain-containing protein [Candidatus Omnitrophota bacterium]